MVTSGSNVPVCAVRPMVRPDVRSVAIYLASLGVDVAPEFFAHFTVDGAEERSGRGDTDGAARWLDRWARTCLEVSPATGSLAGLYSRLCWGPVVIGLTHGWPDQQIADLARAGVTYSEAMLMVDGLDDVDWVAVGTLGALRPL